MQPREFVETRTRRYMAQALETFEDQLEEPLKALVADIDSPAADRVMAGIEPVKRTIRRRMQALATDCIDVMPTDLQINGYSPVQRSRA